MAWRRLSVAVRSYNRSDTLTANATDVAVPSVPSRYGQADLVLPLAAGLAGALLTWLAFRLPPPSTSDFDQLWIGANAVLHGESAYAAVVASGNPYPLFYPMPAVLLAVPFTFFAAEIARALWSGAIAAVFAVAAKRYGRGLPAGGLSACFLLAIVLGQWSPLLVAAVVFPAMGGVWLAKPSLGVAYAAAYPSGRAAISAGVLLAASILVSPQWPVEWLHAIRSSTHTLPVLQPGGFLLLLALLRWRVPEARLLAYLSVVPQITGLVEALPLFLIPRNRISGYVLAVLSYVATFVPAALYPATGKTMEQLVEDRWPFVFVCLYLPALVMVFWRSKESTP